MEQTSIRCMIPSLLVTKLYIPRVSAAFVPRESLVAALESGLGRKLILIAAAAGFGKTTLVADWSRLHKDTFCWLSLDEGDNDPVRFLSYLIAAVQTRRPHIGQELLATLQSPQPPALEHALPILINQLAPEDLILVLDDYHVIQNQAVHTALTTLVDYLPPQMTLVVLTRSDPPLPLARLRAKNELLELRASALRFTVEETAHFLNPFQLSMEDIRALEARTEGWIAGLQLAAAALQTQDSRTFIRSFTGSHRFVLDYLIEEVLSHQPENLRRFLLQTSILHRMNGALCSAVTGEPDGQAVLEYLDKNNLFLIPLDQSRYWYRYHHLFADLLLARLQAESLASLRELRQRAAEWFEDNGLPEEAILYALAAEDFERAAHLITGPAASVTRRGEVATLLDWYRAFPPEFIEQHPRLSLQFGMAFALNGRWDEAEKLLRTVNTQLPPNETLLLAYLVASYQQNAVQLEAIAAEAAALPHPDHLTKLVLALLVSLKSDWRTACQLMAEAQEASEREGDLSAALTALFQRCRMHVFAGELHQAHALSQQALQRVQELGLLPMASLTHAALGRIFIEWNALDRAEHHLLEAIRLGERSGFVTGVLSSATIMLAEVRQAQGDMEGAVRTAEEGLALAERYDPPLEIVWLKTYQARIWLAQGNITAAAAWARSVQPLSTSMFYPNNIQKVTLARVLLAQRKTDDAVALLTSLTTEPVNLLTVETLALLALARQAQGDGVHALLAIEQALTLAESENRIRVFLDLGMTKLLARFLESHPENTFAQKVLALFRPDSPPQIDPLSERELEILRLIVAGYSNDEIAQQLTLALSTIKWYINVLYSKLQVKTRSQAIARAHDLKLV